MKSYSEFLHDYTKSYFKFVEPISEDFRVFLDGKEIPVYTCRISKMPFNRVWPGHQREFNQTEQASFVNLISDEPVTLEILVNRKYEKILLHPYAKKTPYTEENGRVSFTLTEEGQWVLSCDDLHACLYIFNSRPIPAPAPEDVTYYFGSGIHMPGKISLKSNESIYVDQNALVYGAIFAENAENIRIFGNGLFDDSTEERIGNYCYEAYTNGNFRMYDCKNVSVEGVLFRNSATWCISLYHCFDVTLDKIKVFGQWRYNTDGVDIVNSQNITLKNSLIHSFDDTISLKGIDRYINTNNENILVENCVLWCDWGNCCEVGIETCCREYKHITFRGCDILRAGTNTALAVHNGDCAEISDVTFENISVEYHSFDIPPVLQESDEQTYDQFGKLYVPTLFTLTNWRFRTPQSISDWGLPPEYAPVDLTGIRSGMIRDVKLENIDVYYDEKIPQKDGKDQVPMYISSVMDEIVFENVRIANIRINGKQLAYKDALTGISEVRGCTFDDEVIS